MIKIRYKIMLWVAGAGLATSLVFSTAVFLEMREQPLELLDAQLTAMAASLGRQMAGEQHLQTAGTSTRILLASERDWIRVYDEQMRLLYQSALAEVVNLPLSQEKKSDASTVTVPLPKNSLFLSHGEGNEISFRALVVSGDIAGKLRLIQIARPLERFDDELGDLLAAIGVGLLVSTILLLCVSYALSGQIIKPIVLITRRAREINAHTLEKRIPVGKSRDEIFELATCMNQMFDRLQLSFSRQKQYLSDASHELKSPMAMLRIFFEEASLRHGLPPAFQQQLQTQERNVRRMERLVKTLLELSLLEVKNSLNMERFCMAGLIRSVLDDFMPLLEKEQISLASDLPQRLDMRGDKDALRRVMINIMDNAVKYNRGNGQIHILATQIDNRIVISVYNTGLGIPAAELTNVFKQFYRVEKSRSLQYGGSGLGLAMVRKIVRMHGGSVHMDSVEGKWAKITVELPAIGGLSP